MSGPTQNVGLKDQAGADALGFVGDSPADNTLLGRLKAIVTALGSLVLSAGSAIIGKVGIDQTTPGTSDSVTVKAQKIRWSAVFGPADLLKSGVSPPSLKNLANDANKLSGEWDNTDNDFNHLYALLQLKCRGAAAFDASGEVKVWILPAVDGTDYEDGGDSLTPDRDPDYTFTVRAVDTQQIIVIKNVLLPPTKFKLLLRNEAGQAFTNTNGENQLDLLAYNEAVVP